MNVLLLEDEPELSAVAREQLELRGHKVYPADKVALAREILTDEDVLIDVLIADQDVPDGFGARFAIEAKGMKPHIKVAVVSGRLSIDDIEELEGHGIVYFGKPSLYASIVEDLLAN